MSLKTHLNPAERDNLLSYLSTDKVMREQTRKMDAAHQQPASKVEAEPRRFYVEGKLLTKSEWEALKRRHFPGNH